MEEKDAQQYLVDVDLYRIPNVHSSEASSAVLFVHGFTGSGIKTWGEFPERLRDDVDLKGFDFFFWQYPTKLNPIELALQNFWSADPGIELIGKSLRSVLEVSLADYDRLMMVAHSMGGLVVQAFVIEEIERGESKHLDRLAEIVMYATPSGGLASARRVGFLKRQIEDMSRFGPFIENLRAAWRKHIDDRRGQKGRPGRFRLTLIAGNRDKFVPEESSLEPFPLDEHEVVTGNHVQLVKPEKSRLRTLNLLKKRLLRHNPTAEELRIVNGESPVAVEMMAKIRGAMDLGDVSALRGMADGFTREQVQWPTLERALALALSGHREYDYAVTLFDRYLEYEMADGSRPFEQDANAVQQLAVSLSALGQNLKAVQRLEQLPADIRADSETMGIRAGRLKREWLEDQNNLAVGRRAFQTYRAAYKNAKKQENFDQEIYNGINTAFMSLMFEQPYEKLANELIEVADGRKKPDYWTYATKAEALLLLQRFEEARDLYDKTFVEAGTPRNLATTAAQALNIIDKFGNPPGANGIRALIDDNYAELPAAIAEQEELNEQKELAG